MYVPAGEVLRELADFPHVPIDYITFSGRGEPTLAANLGDTIRAVKEARPEKTAVLTNASLVGDAQVRAELAETDFVCLKLDASDEDAFQKINRPAAGVHLDDIITGIEKFRQEYRGRMALQMMFVEENRRCAESMAAIARRVGPDEVQLNTPLRPSGAKPLSREELAGIKVLFGDVPVVSVYEASHKEVKPVSARETMRRRGKRIE